MDWSAGCYVDGTHGTYGISHMVLNVLSDFATDAEKVLMHEYHKGDADETTMDEAQWISLAVEDRFRDHLEPLGLTADWIDGEFFVIEEDLEYA